jgi:photosystem I P700 chlorophyll a apoprotein A2
MGTVQHRMLLLSQESIGIRLALHNGALLGCTSILWAGHSLHVAVPVSRGQDISWTRLAKEQLGAKGLYPFGSLDWCAFCRVPDAPNHEFGDVEYSGTSLLSCIANSTGGALAQTDQSHNHLAVGIVLTLAAHLSLSLFSGFGHSLADIVSAHGTARSQVLTLNHAVHLLLCLSLAGVGTLTSLVSQQCYALNPFCYLSFDLVSYVSLWVHHQYISSILMVGSFSHAGIFLVRDYSAQGSHHAHAQSSSNPTRPQQLGGVAKVQSHSSVIVSTLSSLALFLGAHVLGIFVHNDVVCAFGEVEKQLLLEPVFAELVQQSAGKDLYAFGTLVPASGVPKT